MAQREKFSIWGREPDTKKGCYEFYQDKKKTWPLNYVLNKEETKHVIDFMSNYYCTPLKGKAHRVQGAFHSVKDKIIEIKVTYHEIYGSSSSTRLEFWIKKPTYKDEPTFGLVDGKVASYDKNGKKFTIKAVDDPGKMYPFSVARCICFKGNGMVNESDPPKVAVKDALRHATSPDRLQWKRDQGYRPGIDPRQDAHHIDGKEFKTIYLKFLGAIKMSEEELINLIYPEHGNFETNHIVYSEDGTDWKFKDTERGLKINAAFFEFHYRNREYEMMDPKPHAKLTADETKFNTSIRHKIKEKITDEL